MPTHRPRICNPDRFHWIASAGLSPGGRYLARSHPTTGHLEKSNCLPRCPQHNQGCGRLRRRRPQLIKVPYRIFCVSSSSLESESCSRSSSIVLKTGIYLLDRPRLQKDFKNFLLAQIQSLQRLQRSSLSKPGKSSVRGVDNWVGGC